MVLQGPVEWYQSAVQQIIGTTHRRLSLLVAAAVSITAGVSLQAGCGGVFDSCFAASERPCAAQPGLVVRECDDSWEFTDGFKTGNDQAAFDHCYCSESIPCDDGRSAVLCGSPQFDSTFGLDVSQSATFDDGTVLSAEEGAAVCFGFSSCTIESSRCSEGRYYFVCSIGDSESFIAWDGTEFDAETPAENYCSGDPLDTANMYCRGEGTSCAGLSETDCELQLSCYFSSFDGCTGEASCEHIGTATECNLTPPCNWG